MAEPVTVRLSGDDGGVGRVTSAKKKFKNVQVEFFFKDFFCFQPNSM